MRQFTKRKCPTFYRNIMRDIYPFGRTWTGFFLFNARQQKGPTFDLTILRETADILPLRTVLARLKRREWRSGKSALNVSLLFVIILNGSPFLKCLGTFFRFFLFNARQQKGPTVKKLKILKILKIFKFSTKQGGVIFGKSTL